MKVLIASDSFKDALSAMEVCKAISKGLLLASSKITPVLFPMADGGEGTSEILTFHSGGHMLEVDVQDPLFRPIKASYGLSGDKKTAFIEMAEASGIQLLKPEERKASQTSSIGTGELLKDAMHKGVSKILLGIGGSATNDAGMGMATALGFKFLDKNKKVLSPIGANLIKVDQVVSPDNWNLHCAIEVICDVDNPLFGPKGAAYIYSPQKGASEEEVKLLDAGLKHFAQVLEQAFRKDYSEIAGTGAAGGLGFGALTFLNAGLKPGIEALMDYTNFEAQLEGVDLIITGEGRLDQQTLNGKLIQGICKMANSQSVPVIALCGSLEASPEQIKAIGLKAAYSILNRPMSLQEALADTACLLEKTSFNVINTWLD